jgi:hypothetical protein
MSTHMTRAEGAPLALQPILAGILGAIGTDAFISIAHRTSPVQVWQFIASAAFGPIAFTSPQYAVIGVVMHLVIALVWAYLYVIVWSRVNSLHNWVLGGIVWGVVVDVVMDAFMAFRGVLGPVNASTVSFGLITNVVFFGLIVAWYLSRRVRA